MTSRNRKIIGIFVVIASALSLAIAELAHAQTSSVWSEAINVSRSGGSSQPAFAASPDGSLHAVWWDAQDGAQYAQTTDIVTTTWTQPTTLPDIYGKRTEDAVTKHVSLTPPRSLDLVSAAPGELFTFWFDADNQLITAVARDGVWGTAEPLAQAVLAIDTATSSNGALHVAAARYIDSNQQPAGLYYLVNQNGRWSNPRLVYASPYFRTIKLQDVHLSVAGNAQGQVLMAWDDPLLGQSLYARSEDGGTTWSTPQPVPSAQGAGTRRAYVATAPAGEFFILWQEPGTGGCGYVQSRTTDGGLSWSAPEKVLSGLSRCEENLSFLSDSTGALWLTGQLGSVAETSRNRVSLAKWDGNRWSDPLDISYTFSDPVTDRAITLNCLHVAIAGQTAGLFGCDSVNDVWAARNAVALDQVIVAGRPIWSPIVALSDTTASASENDMPALVTDTGGNFLALWSQEKADGSGAIGLYGATSNGTRWSRPIALMRASDGSIPNLAHLQEPALSIDEQDKVHAVWSTGTNGPLQYSSAYARDFVLPQAWAPPISLPVPDQLASWPDVASDPRSGLVYVIYAVPFNEKRGVYLARSNDSGTTWLTPTLIFDAAAAQWTNVDKPRLALDVTANVLHAVWLHSVPAGGVGSQAIYYTRSTDQGATWSEPVKVIEGNVDWPRLAIPSTGQVYLAWNAAENTGQADPATPLKVRGQFSMDGGQRWSPASEIAGFERVSGPIGLTVGGPGQMYLAAIGQGSGQETVLLNAKWNGQAWETREPLPLGQPAAAGNAAVVAVNPAKGQLMTVLRMHTLDQLQASHATLSSTGRQVEIGQVVPMPTFTPMPTATTVPKPTSTPQPTPRPTINAKINLPSTGNGGSNPLIMGGVLAAVIVISVFAVVVWRQRRQHR
jgi:hypothetical protein